MQEFKKEQTFWPTAQQELLLRASLLKGKQATDAWEEWISTVDIDHLDLGSLRTLPLLYRNLHTQGVKHPLMSKLRGIYRLSWYKNQTLFHHIGSVLAALLVYCGFLDPPSMRKCIPCPMDQSVSFHGPHGMDAAMRSVS